MGGSSSSGRGSSGADPVSIAITTAIAFVIIAAITAVNNFGGWVFRVTHGGYGPPGARPLGIHVY